MHTCMHRHGHKQAIHMDMDEHAIEESKMQKAEKSQSLADQLPHNPHIPLWHLFPLDLFKPPFFSICSDGPNSPQTQSRILSSDIRSVKLSLVSANYRNLAVD